MCFLYCHSEYYIFSLFKQSNTILLLNNRSIVPNFRINTDYIYNNKFKVIVRNRRSSSSSSPSLISRNINVKIPKYYATSKNLTFLICYFGPLAFLNCVPATLMYLSHRNVTPITTTTTTTTTTKTTTTTTSTTTTTTTASTTTSKAREIQTTTTSESSATTESKMAILRTKLEQMKSRPDVDPKVELLLKMLNETMSTPKGKELEILNLMMEMMEKLQKKADEQIPISSTTLSSNLTNSLLPPELPEQQAAASINTQHQDQVESNELDILENQLDKCSDLSLYKILPGDDQEMARRKHGALMKCYMDENADPCDKFYDYACGNWNQVRQLIKKWFLSCKIESMFINILRIGKGISKKDSAFPYSNFMCTQNLPNAWNSIFSTYFSIIQYPEIKVATTHLKYLGKIWMQN